MVGHVNGRHELLFFSHPLKKKFPFWNLSLRDSSSAWILSTSALPPLGTQIQDSRSFIKLEFQRLKMLVYKIVLKLAN